MRIVKGGKRPGRNDSDLGESPGLRVRALRLIQVICGLLVPFQIVLAGIAALAGKVYVRNRKTTSADEAILALPKSPPVSSFCLFTPSDYGGTMRLSSEPHPRFRRCICLQ